MVEFTGETLFTLVAVESDAIADLHRSLFVQLTDEKVHGDIFTIHLRLHVATDLFGHDGSVELQIPAVEKSSAGQDHRIGARGRRSVVLERLRAMRSRDKTDQPRSILFPKSESHFDFIVPEITVVVQGKNTVGANELVPGQKAIVQIIRQIEEIDDLHVNRGQMYSVITEKIAQRAIRVPRRGERIELIEENDHTIQIDQTVQMN